MRFLLDHDVPTEVAHLLRHWGHDAIQLKGVLPTTVSDDEVFRHAQADGRIVVSCNRADFLNLSEQAAKNDEQFAGVIILIRRRSRQAECAHLLQLLHRAGDRGLANNITFA